MCWRRLIVTFNYATFSGSAEGNRNCKRVERTYRTRYIFRFCLNPRVKDKRRTTVLDFRLRASRYEDFGTRPSATRQFDDFYSCLQSCYNFLNIIIIINIGASITDQEFDSILSLIVREPLFSVREGNNFLNLVKLCIERLAVIINPKTI